MRRFRIFIIVAVYALLFVLFTVCASAYTGDLNGDFCVDSNDAAVFSRYLAECAVTIELNNADINGDGKINSGDAVNLLQYLSGMRDDLFSSLNPVEDSCNYTVPVSEELFGDVYHSVVLPRLLSKTDAADDFNGKIISRHCGTVEILKSHDEKNVLYDISYTYYDSNGIIGIMVCEAQTVADSETTEKHYCYYFDTVKDRELNYLEYLEALGVNYSSVVYALNSTLPDGEKKYSTNYKDFEINKVIIGESAARAAICDDEGNERSINLTGSFVGKTAQKYDLSLVIENLYTKDTNAFDIEVFSAPIEAFIADADGDGNPELIARYLAYSYEYICAWKLIGSCFEEFEIYSAVRLKDDGESAYMILDKEGAFGIISVITRKVSDTETSEIYYSAAYSDGFDTQIMNTDLSFKIESRDDGDVYYIDKSIEEYTEISKEEYESYRGDRLDYIEKYSVSMEKFGFKGVWQKQRTLLGLSDAENTKLPISSEHDSSIVSDAVRFEKGVSDELLSFALPDKNHSVALPKISIDTEAAEKFNARILKKHSDPILAIENGGTGYNFYDIDYSYAICNNIIGILVRDSRSVVGSYAHCDYSGYYFDVANDRELNYFEYLSALGVNYSSVVYSLNSYIKGNGLGTTYSTDYVDYDIPTAIFTDDSAVLVLPAIGFKEETVVLEESFTDRSEIRYDVADVLERYYYEHRLKLGSNRAGVELTGYFIADLDKNGTPELAIEFLETSHYCEFFSAYVFDNGIVKSEYSFGEAHGSGYIDDLNFLFNEDGEIVIFNVSETSYSNYYYVDIVRKTWTEFGFDSSRYENVYLHTEGEDDEEKIYFYKAASDGEYTPITEKEYYEYIEWMRDIRDECIWPSGRSIWEQQKEIYSRS